MSAKYANFEWLVFERELNLSKLFDDTETQLRDVASDADARAIIDRSLRSIADGHVRVQWPVMQAGSGAASGSSRPLCARLGYDAAMIRSQPVGPRIPGYRALPDTSATEFPSGLLTVGTAEVGFIRIGMFMPQAFPQLCDSAREQLKLGDGADCPEKCAEQVDSAAYSAMSRDLARRIRSLRKLGATTLLIDITGNGGGSEWAEAAARMVSPISLKSERRYAVRGQHWVDYWNGLISDLRGAEKAASRAERRQLQQWIAQVEQARKQAGQTCSAEPFWQGQHPTCEWLSPAFSATGILAQADARSLHAKPWGSTVFSPAEYEFEESVWQGPVLVLVDAGTGSAAEEFAAVLQDNHAAVIIGSPTAGAGCGHTDGGTPTTLQHSQGVLQLPDCARLRSDGTNEVRGIDPDVLVGFRTTDGLQRKALRLAPLLQQRIDFEPRLCGTGCRPSP